MMRWSERQRAMLKELALHRMQFTAFGHAFNGRHALALGLDRENEHTVVVTDHGPEILTAGGS